MAPGRGGNAETLRRYWAEGEGAAKIGWGTGGDFNRCVEHLSKYVSGAKGMCNLLHKRALGYYPATHAKMSHDANLLEASVALGIAQPAVLALGSWNSMLHPRVAAGSAGGGKFTSSGGGKGGKGGKGAKGGGKGAKGAAAAAKAAQAQQVYANFLKMNPQQRSAFLAGLTNPQLSALLKVANAGNSNDPATRAALTAIKDQMAARSLTGAKGPTAINAGKAAAAAKSAAGKQASAKKASAAQASAAKKQTTAQNTAARKQLAAAKAAASAQAKAQKTSVANQAASLKAQAAMNAPTHAAQVAGLTSALKSTSNPAQQQQILAQLKKALGLAQTAGVAEVLALASTGHRFRHGWIPIDGGASSKGAPKLPAGVAHRAVLAVNKDVKTRRQYAAKLSDKHLDATDKAFDQRAVRHNRAGQVDTPHRTVREEKARRAALADPKGASKDPATIRAAIKALDAKKKSGQLTSVLHAQQTAKLKAQLAKALQVAGRKATRLAAEPGDALRLAYMPNTSSGDGAAITVSANLRQKYAKQGIARADGSFPIPDRSHLRKALKAVGRAKPADRPAVRAHIRKRAKALGVDLRDSSVGNGG